jgi:hypothetical protein
MRHAGNTQGQRIGGIVRGLPCFHGRENVRYGLSLKCQGDSRLSSSDFCNTSSRASTKRCQSSKESQSVLRQKDCPGKQQKSLKLLRLKSSHVGGGEASLLWLCHKLIAEPTNRQQVLWFGGIIFNIATQAHDEIIDRARIGIFLQVPDLLQNFFARHGTPADCG